MVLVMALRDTKVGLQPASMASLRQPQKQRHRQKQTQKAVGTVSIQQNTVSVIYDTCQPTKVMGYRWVFLHVIIHTVLSLQVVIMQRCITFYTLAKKYSH